MRSIGVCVCLSPINTGTATPTTLLEYYEIKQLEKRTCLLELLLARRIYRMGGAVGEYDNCGYAEILGTAYGPPTL